METLLTHTVVLVVGFGLGVLFSRNVRDGLADARAEIVAHLEEIKAKL